MLNSESEWDLVGRAEQDPRKFLELTAEIDRLLNEKERSTKYRPPSEPFTPANVWFAPNDARTSPEVSRRRATRRRLQIQFSCFSAKEVEWQKRRPGFLP